MKTSPPPSNNGRSGFTLVEIFVVVAIIGILASLLLVSLDSVRTKASRAVATSNLRQLSVAIMSYAADNNNSLPGPLNFGQGPRYSRTVTDSLGYMLYAYLGLPEPTSADQAFPLLSSPNFVKYRKDPTSPSYVMNQQIPQVQADGTTNMIQPWGRQGAGGSAPMKLVAIAGLGNAETNSLVGTWAMTEVDRKNVGVVTPSGNPGWKTKLPLTPVHGDVRISMFFDWHAQAISTK